MLVPDQRIEVLGSKGMLQAENPRQTTVILSNENGSTTDVTPYSFPERYVVTYATELDHFAGKLPLSLSWRR